MLSWIKHYDRFISFDYVTLTYTVVNKHSQEYTMFLASRKSHGSWGNSRTGWHDGNDWFVSSVYRTFDDRTNDDPDLDIYCEVNHEVCRT